MQTPSKMEINAKLLPPPENYIMTMTGQRVDLDCELLVLMPWLGSEDVSAKELDALVSLRGVRFCQFWASWLPRKVAQQYRAGKPVPKPAGLFIRAVREGWEVDPRWPEFDERKHTSAAKKHFQAEQIPSNVSAPQIDYDDEEIPF